MPNNVPYWKLNPFFGEGEDVPGKGYKPPPSDYYYRRPPEAEYVEDELIPLKPPRPLPDVPPDKPMQRPQATPQQLADMQAQRDWIHAMRGIEHTPNTMQDYLGTLSPEDRMAYGIWSFINPGQELPSDYQQSYSDWQQQMTLSDYAQAGIPHLSARGGPGAAGGWDEWLNPTSGPSFLDELVDSLRI